MRSPFVIKTARPISGRSAARMSSKMRGWLVGSPPQMATDSHFPSALTNPSMVLSKTSSGMCDEYWLSTMQMGHSRLQ